MRHGFSRLEALCLTLVFAVLAVVILPATAQFDILFGTREYKRRNLCWSNLKNVGLAFTQYSQDYDEKYPPVRGSNTPSKLSEGSDFGWASNIQPYLRNTQVLQCPSEKHAANADPTKAGYTDYWYNRNFSRFTEPAARKSASTFLSGDGDGGSLQSNARYSLNVLPASWWKTPGSPARRHLDMSIYLFGDGHAKPLPVTDIGKATGYGFKVVR